MSEAIDYRRDSLAEITLKQAETIERQGARIIMLLMENMALREDADSVIAAEYDRLVEALLLVEGWVFNHVQAEPGEASCNAGAMHRILTECLDYAESNVKPPWFEAAKAASEAEASGASG